MAAVVTIEDSGRGELLSSMHKETAKVAKYGYQKLSRFANAGVLLCIELGCQIDRLTDNEAVADDAVEVTKLAAYWGITNTNQLYEWRNTAAVFCKTTDEETGEIVYDQSFISDQTQDPLVNGKCLQFEHFKHLGRVSSSRKRTTLLNQTRKNGWSSNDLANEIKGSVADTSNKRSAGGRKPVIPGTVFQFVQKAYTQTLKLDNFLIASEPAVLDKFEEVSTDKADDKFIEKIDSTIGGLEHLQKTIQRNIDILLDGRDRVVTVIENTIDHVESIDAEDSAEEYVTGTQMAAKIREAVTPKKKKKTAKKQLRPRKSKK
tara:strand:- start:4019 stop:4972 length:954 start_codon:yes stop_codon:yes gene_type:complete